MIVASGKQGKVFLGEGYVWSLDVEEGSTWGEGYIWSLDVEINGGIKVSGNDSSY